MPYLTRSWFQNDFECHHKISIQTALTQSHIFVKVGFSFLKQVRKKKKGLNSFYKDRKLRFRKMKLNIFHKSNILGIKTALYCLHFNDLMSRCSFRTWSKILAKVSKFRKQKKNQEGHDGPESLTWVSFPTKWILPSLLLFFQLMTPGMGPVLTPGGIIWIEIDIGPNIIVQGQMIKVLLLLVSEKKNFKVFLLCSYVSNLWPLGQGKIWPRGHHMNNLGRGPLGDATYEISKLCNF